MHTQTGVWLTTRHSALKPQAPGHGSLQCRFIQAKLLEQSEFVTHSGRQFGGFPMKSARQEQEYEFPVTRHSAY